MSQTGDSQSATKSSGGSSTEPAAHSEQSIKDMDKFPELAKWFLWTDSPHKVERVVIGLAVFCGLLFVIDLFYHRHAYFGFEGSRGFYAIAGFAAFTVIVLAAGQLRRLIKRPEDYYGKQATNAEIYPDEGLSIRVSEGFTASVDVRSVVPADRREEEGGNR